MTQDKLVIRGAREHNLKNITIEIPRDQLVAAFAARPISIATPGGSIVASVVADPETGYTVSLQPGTYTVVDIRHRGIGGSRDLPRTVTLRSGETVWLNISIDTGIR